MKLDKFEHSAAEDIKVVRRGDAGYPAPLENIYDPPGQLFFRGKLLEEDKLAVAIVGARKCSIYGMEMAGKLAFELAARGITVVSGMARGIDTAAHRGALKAGGRTIAVMGGGFRHIFPPEAAPLAERIAMNGAVITEFEADMSPDRWTFPKRNRIISGLSLGVVVVEAGDKSGALITSDFALEQGREVFAVPGRADSPYSCGTNKLIKQGAKMACRVEDILEELPVEFSEELSGPRAGGEEALSGGGERHKAGLTGEEEAVLGTLEENAVHIDRILEETGMDSGKVHAAVLSLELKKRIEVLPGRFCRASQ